jgi:hypothetical protein
MGECLSDSYITGEWFPCAWLNAARGFSEFVKLILPGVIGSHKLGAGHRMSHFALEHLRRRTLWLERVWLHSWSAFVSLAQAGFVQATNIHGGK